jgi:hypothetical protein
LIGIREGTRFLQDIGEQGQPFGTPSDRSSRAVCEGYLFAYL